MTTPIFPIGFPGPDSGSQAAAASLPDNSELLDAYSRAVTHAVGRTPVEKSAFNHEGDCGEESDHKNNSSGDSEEGLRSLFPVREHAREGEEQQQRKNYGTQNRAHAGGYALRQQSRHEPRSEECSNTEKRVKPGHQWLF